MHHSGKGAALVLGIGNILWADEGFGVRAVEALHQAYEFPAEVKLMDGGTQGLYLLPLVQDADILVIFDAIDYGLPAGTLKLVDDHDVPSYLGVKKMSLHQTGFQEVLALSAITGRYPTKVRLIGVQPLDLDTYGGSLTEPVRSQMEPSLAVAIRFLMEQGFPSRRRISGCVPESLCPPSVNLAHYEAGILVGGR